MRGFREQGTTTTPFDMVVLNGISRYHLAIEALRRARRIPENSPALVERFNAQLQEASELRRGAPRGHARGARLDLVAALSARRARRAGSRRERVLRRAAARVGLRPVFRLATTSNSSETGRWSSTGWRKGRSARTR